MRALIILIALLSIECASFAPLDKPGQLTPDGKLVVVSASRIGGKKQIVHYREVETGLDLYVVFDGVFPMGFQTRQCW